MNACKENDKIITKQLVIDLPMKLSTKLIPVTANEKAIDEIQKELDNFAKQSKLLKLYIKRDEYLGTRVDTKFILDLELQIQDLIEELENEKTF